MKTTTKTVAKKNNKKSRSVDPDALLRAAQLMARYHEMVAAAAATK